MTTRLNRWLLALILIVGIPYYWLLIDDRPGQVEPHHVSIAQLRHLARSGPGPAPASISYETVAWRYLPRIILAAGQGTRPVRFDLRAYRLAVPNGPPIMIDTGLSAAAARRSGFEHYQADAQALINAELKMARLVVTLSDKSSYGGAIEPAGPKPSAGKPDAGVNCPGIRALAKGIVEIPICDDVIASRMIYVRLSDGREYLLAGDIAPTSENVRYQAGPSRLANDFFRTQDQKAIHRWLRTIGQLQKQAPHLIVVPGHDPLPKEDMQLGFYPPGTL